MKKSLAVMLALIMVLCMIPTTAFAATMSWEWTVTIIGGNYYRADGTQSNNRYKINQHLDNSVPHEIGYKFEWNASAGGNNYNGGWQLCLTVDGNIVERSTAYIYEKDMSNASGTWTAPASSHTGTSTHPFILYLSNYQNRFQNITLNYDANEGIGAPDPETQKVEKGQSATFTVSTQKPTRENYTFKGWSTDENAATAEYIGGKSITISQNTTLYAVWEENNPTPPTPPTTDKPELPKPENTPGIPGLTGAEVVNVKCTTNSSHAKKSYSLIADSYDVGNVEGDATSGYTCTITVQSEKYVNDYNAGINVNHTLDGSPTGTIKLEWDGSKWKAVSGVPVVFNVKCDKTQPENPAELTSFVKSRVTVTPDNMSTLPEGVTFNTDFTVTFNDNNTTANLLYSFTVKGTPGAKVTITDTGAKFYNGTDWNTADIITVTLPNGEGDKAEITVYGYRTFSVGDIKDGKLVNNATANVEGGDPVSGQATVTAENKTGPGSSEKPEPSPSTDPSPKPTPTPYNGGGGHSHYYPTTTPVPVIVIPPKTGDMTIWQSILHFLGIR